MLTKEKIIKLIENMPEKFSSEEVIERIVLIQKIEIGLEQSENSETYSTEELRKELKKWFN
jgi:hypothetical protein